MENKDSILPIEIKSGKDYKRHNALSNVILNDEYNISEAIVFSNGNIESEGKVLYMPIYMLMYLQPEEIADPIFKFKPI